MPLAQYEPQVRFVLPRQHGGGTLSVDAAAAGDRLTAMLSDTGVAGLYEAQWAQRARRRDRHPAVRLERRSARKGISTGSM